MLFVFSTPALIRHLWQLKAVVFLHGCLIHTVLFDKGGCKIESFFLCRERINFAGVNFLRPLKDFRNISKYTQATSLHFYIRRL